MAQRQDTLTGRLNVIAKHVDVPAQVPPPEAHSREMEEVLLYYCVGKGKFSPDVKFINLQMEMYDIHGRWVGWQFGMHESERPFEQLLTVPESPPEPIDTPPIPRQEVLEWTKGQWIFADGSAIYAAGPARSQLIPLNNGDFHFKVTTGQIITNGTGVYEGCAGIKEATGTTLVPASIISSGNFPRPGLEFDARTFETFRIVRKSFVQT
jgi:hypothetical protein